MPLTLVTGTHPPCFKEDLHCGERTNSGKCPLVTIGTGSQEQKAIDAKQTMTNVCAGNKFRITKDHRGAKGRTT